MNPFAVATVAAAHDGPELLALGEAIHRHHPTAELRALIVDDLVAPAGTPPPGWRTVDPNELPVPAEVVVAAASTHTADELFAVLAPTLLRSLTDDSGRVVVLVPPTATVGGPLDDLVAAAERSGWSVVPRIDVPTDRHTERWVAEHGVHDPTLMAVTAGGAGMLRWWERHALDAAPPFGRSVVDLAVALFPHERCRSSLVTSSPPRRTLANRTTAVDRGVDDVAIPTRVKRAVRDADPAPDLFGPAGGRGAISWYEAREGREPRSLTRWALPRGGSQDPPGVNVVGYVSAEAGVGEMARLAVDCLEAAGIDHTVLPVSTEGNQREDHDGTSLGTIGGLFDVNLIVLPPSHLDDFMDHVGPSLLADRPTVGYWAWEVESVPPAMIAAQRHVDEVWGLSTFTSDVLARHLDVPVHPLVLPARQRPAPPARTRRSGESPLFLFCFDHLSVFDRKHPDGVVAAFRSAFAPGEARLIVKSINAGAVPHRHEELEAMAADRSDIHIVDGHLDATKQRAMVDGCDCYVSLHRAEGYGLTIAEAMMAAKPVIVTDYSGPTDFTSHETAHLVPARSGVVGDGAGPYPPGTPWADPDLDAAARAMRTVVDDPVAAAAMGQRARDMLLAEHAPGHRAAFLHERLAALRKLVPGADAAASAPGRPIGVRPSSPRLALR